MSKLFLVRHAQSESNVEPSVLRKQTNVSVNLTTTGIEQAKETAKFLTEYHKKNPATIKIWNSPYFRTRQTASYIKEAFKKSDISFDEEESIYICERQFGLLDDNSESRKTHSKEYEHYKLYSNTKHDFWARPPLGESPFDMCLRLDTFTKTILFEKQYDHHIIISHGAAIKGFIMMKQKLSFEDYASMINPYNASVNLINQDKFEGIIFQPETISL